MLKNKNLSRIADDLVERADKFQALRDIANRKNYPVQIKQLTLKIQEQYDFWVKKPSSSRLIDLERDLNFIKTQLEATEINKVRIDELSTKYNIGYDKNRNPL